MNGNDVAQQLYIEFRPKLVRYLASRVSNFDDRDELLSEIFLLILRNLDRYDPAKASYSTWIYAIAHNAVTSYYRSHRTHLDIDEQVLPCDFSVEQLVVCKETLSQLSLAMQALSQRERDIVLARYYFELDYRTISEKLEITESNARIILFRALKKLKEIMGFDGELTNALSTSAEKETQL